MSESTVATTSCLTVPLSLPTAIASSLPLLARDHLIGPIGNDSRGFSQDITFWISGSREGNDPHSHFKDPPYWLGMFSGSIYFSKVAFASWAERIKILETVIGSNHRLIQDQTVGKNDGAPMI